MTKALVSDIQKALDNVVSRLDCLYEDIAHINIDIRKIGKKLTEVSDRPVDGTFTLTLNGKISVPIPFDATDADAEIEAAIVKLRKP